MDCTYIPVTLSSAMPVWEFFGALPPEDHQNYQRFGAKSGHEVLSIGKNRIDTCDDAFSVTQYGGRACLSQVGEGTSPLRLVQIAGYLGLREHCVMCSLAHSKTWEAPMLSLKAMSNWSIGEP